MKQLAEADGVAHRDSSPGEAQRPSNSRRNDRWVVQESGRMATNGENGCMVAKSRVKWRVRGQARAKRVRSYSTIKAGSEVAAQQ